MLCVHEDKYYSMMQLKKKQLSCKNYTPHEYQMKNHPLKVTHKKRKHVYETIETQLYMLNKYGNVFKYKFRWLELATHHHVSGP